MYIEMKTDKLEEMLALITRLAGRNEPAQVSISNDSVLYRIEASTEREEEPTTT